MKWYKITWIVCSVVCAFAIGFGLFKGAYSGFDIMDQNGGKGKAEFHKDKLCLTGDFDGCLNYCKDDDAQVNDIFYVFCETKDFRKHTKNLNIASFTLAGVGIILIIVGFCREIPSIVSLLSSGLCFVGSTLGFVAAVYFTSKNEEFAESLYDDTKVENIYFYSFYMLWIGSIGEMLLSVLLLGCYSKALKSSK